MFPQWTQAVSAADWTSGNPFYKATAIAAGVTAALTVVVLSLAQPWCLIFVAEIAAFTWTVSFPKWWLYDRLIANPENQSATSGPPTDETVIGLLTSVEAIGGSFPDNFDTDYCFDLLLENIKSSTPDTPTYDAAPYPGPYGYVMKEQLALWDLQQANAGGYGMKSFTGHGSNLTTLVAPCVHCEIEGKGMYDLLTSTTALLVATSIAMAAALAIGEFWPWGAVLSALMALLAFLFGWAASNDQANPSQITPPISGPLVSLATSTPNQPADLLMVTGTWVYDTMHSGWNELHPVKSWQRAGTWKGSWPSSIPPSVGATLVAMKKSAMSPSTKAAQLEPQNQWKLHPLVDGCTPNSGPTIP
jgi:hypothetical protein